ncbi:hypothetical protein P8452_03530 [Trifolium repens]|nr:hypothetical protein P8452_03530 [Trifolium repens]
MFAGRQFWCLPEELNIFVDKIMLYLNWRSYTAKMTEDEDKYVLLTIGKVEFLKLKDSILVYLGSLICNVKGLDS